MAQLLKDSGLTGMKGSVQYCSDCRKPTVHYRTPDGWPICNTCGYNEEMAALCAELDQEAATVPSYVSTLSRSRHAVARHVRTRRVS